MAKTYVDSVKYMIHTEFEIDGVVDKPDIVGAVFGQSEGLLGESMDLKELQKAGKVGRIEINFKHHLGKTRGEILSPSSMDMVQTSLLAATFESVDKVGPCDAKFATKNIEDVRSEKRAKITSRAQELLKQFKMAAPAAQELETEVREEARAAAVKNYGRDKLPGGPAVVANAEIILVEGRADVINLLRNNINNALGIGGAKVSKDVPRIARGKLVTAFIDGDRGGELNARKLVEMMPIDYMAQAPAGKEVEELAGKEIVSALRKRVPAEEFFAKTKYVPSHTGRARPPPSRAPAREVVSTGTAPGRTAGGRDFGRAPSRGRAPAGRAPYRGTSSRARAGTGAREHYRDRPYRDRPYRDRPRERGYDPRRPPRPRERAVMPYLKPGLSARPYEGARAAGVAIAVLPKPSAEEAAKFSPIMGSLKGKLKAKLLDKDMKEIAEADVRELLATMEAQKGVHAAVFDGIITQRLADAAEAQGVKYLIGVKKGRVKAGKETKLLVMD